MLGCTHFPVLADAIREAIGEDVAHRRFGRNHGAAVAEALAAKGMGSDGAAADVGRLRFFATDSPERFARVGAIFLGPADRSSRVSSWSTSGLSQPDNSRRSVVACCRAARPNLQSGLAVRSVAGALASAALPTSRSRLMSQRRPSSRNTARP